MKFIDFGTVQGYNLYDIFQADKRTKRFLEAGRLITANAIDLSLGKWFQQGLENELHRAFNNGHRHIDMTFHRYIARLITVARVNSPRLQADQTWRYIAEFPVCKDICELNFHCMSDPKLSIDHPNLLKAQGAALFGKIAGCIQERLAQGILHFHLVVPKDTLELVRFYREQAA